MTKCKPSVTCTPMQTRHGVVVDARFPVCPLCQKSFSSDRSRSRHLIRVHGVNNNDTEVFEESLKKELMEDDIVEESVIQKDESLEDDEDRAPSPALSYISITESVTARSVLDIDSDHENDINQSEHSLQENDLVSTNQRTEDDILDDIKSERSSSPALSYISVTPSIREFDVELFPLGTKQPARKYSCFQEGCCKTFTNIAERNAHSRLEHTKIVSAGKVKSRSADECPACGKVFSISGGLTRHFNRVHLNKLSSVKMLTNSEVLTSSTSHTSQTSNNQVPPISYKCLCSQSFLTQSELEKHFNSCKIRIMPSVNKFKHPGTKEKLSWETTKRGTETLLINPKSLKTSETKTATIKASSSISVHKSNTECQKSSRESTSSGDSDSPLPSLNTSAAPKSQKPVEAHNSDPSLTTSADPKSQKPVVAHNCEFDWHQLVKTHKTSKFALIPLYYTDDAPDYVGTCIKRNTEEKQVNNTFFCHNYSISGLT